MILTDKQIMWNDQELQAMFARFLPRVPIPFTLAQQLSERVLREVAHLGKRDHPTSTEDTMQTGKMPDGVLCKNALSSLDRFAHK